VRSNSAQLIDVRVDLVSALSRHLSLVALFARALAQLVGDRGAVLGSLNLRFGLSAQLEGFFSLFFETSLARPPEGKHEEHDREDGGDGNHDP
jgi:hypothetical protein